MSTPAPNSPANQPPTFEQSLTQLQKIVTDLENGTLGLEESLGRFEQGVGLLKSCYQILEQAEQRIEVLTGFDEAGQPRTTPFDATATIEQAPASPRKSPSKRSSKTMFTDSE
jgi:exodeoxyribonuclease VII small subunit